MKFITKQMNIQHFNYQIGETKQVQTLYLDFKKLEQLLKFQKTSQSNKKNYKSQKKQRISKNTQNQNKNISIQRCRSQYQNSLRKIKYFKTKKSQKVQCMHPNMFNQLKQVKTKLFQTQKCLQNNQNAIQKCLQNNRDVSLRQKVQNILQKLQNNIPVLVLFFKNAILNWQINKAKILNIQNQVKIVNQVQKIKQRAYQLNSLANQLLQEYYKIQNKNHIFQIQKSAKNDHNQYFRNLQIKIEELSQKLQQKEKEQIKIKNESIKFQKELNNYKQIIKNKEQIIILLNLEISSLNLQLSQTYTQKNKFYIQIQQNNENQLFQKQNLKFIKQIPKNAVKSIKQLLFNVSARNTTMQKTQKTNQQINQQIVLQQFVNYKSQIGGSDLSSIKDKQIDQNQEIDIQLQNNFNNFKQVTKQKAFQDQSLNLNRNDSNSSSN